MSSQATRLKIYKQIAKQKTKNKRIKNKNQKNKKLRKGDWKNYDKKKTSNEI